MADTKKIEVTNDEALEYLLRKLPVDYSRLTPEDMDVLTAVINKACLALITEPLFGRIDAAMDDYYHDKKISSIKYERKVFDAWIEVRDQRHDFLNEKIEVIEGE